MFWPWGCSRPPLAKPATLTPAAEPLRPARPRLSQPDDTVFHVTPAPVEAGPRPRAESPTEHASSERVWLACHWVSWFPPGRGRSAMLKAPDGRR